MASSPGGDARLRIRSPQTTGLAGGAWCGFGSLGEAPLDQRGDDGRSLVFDSAPLDEPLEMLGFPELSLAVSVDKPVAMIAVRLNDVAPNGGSERVSYGVLNLTHRENHENPQAVRPGEKFQVGIRLNAAAHRFAAGHAVRVAISTAYWPLVWPAPAPVSMSLYTRGSVLELPIRPADPDDDRLPPFAPAEAATGTSHRKALKEPRYQRSLERDLTGNEVTYRIVSEGGDLANAAVVRIEEIDLDLGHSIERCFRIVEGDPLSARAEITERLMLRRGDWQVKVHAHTELTADANAFRVRAVLNASEGGEQVFAREWDESVPRDLV